MASAATNAESTPPDSPSTTRSKPTRLVSFLMKPTRMLRTRGRLIVSSPLSSGSAATGSVRAVGPLIPESLQLAQREVDLLVAQQGRDLALALNLATVDASHHELVALRQRTLVVDRGALPRGNGPA